VSALVYLHGYDDDVDTWDDPATAIAPDGATVVKLPGPLVLTSGSRAWFETDERTGPDAEQIRVACAAVDDALDAIEGRGVDRADIALVGFSQGAAVALIWARTTARPSIGALAAIAGWFPDAEGFDPFASSSFAATRTLVAYGEDDDAVPALLSRSAAKLLDRDGVDVTVVELETGHDPRPFVPSVRSWLAEAAG